MKPETQKMAFLLSLSRSEGKTILIFPNERSAVRSRERKSDIIVESKEGLRANGCQRIITLRTPPTAEQSP